MGSIKSGVVPKISHLVIQESGHSNGSPKCYVRCSVLLCFIDEVEHIQVPPCSVTGTRPIMESSENASDVTLGNTI